MGVRVSDLTGDTYKWITRGIIRTLAVGCLMLGLAMIYGGAERFSGPSFATARLVPGAVYTWGGTIALAGAVVLAGILAHWFRRIVITGLWLMAVWFMFFVVSLGLTTLLSPQAAVTGPFAYGMLATVCVVIAVAGMVGKQ